MRYSILAWICVSFIAACGQVSNGSDTPSRSIQSKHALPPLTLAELHRVGNGGEKDCELEEDGNWRCFERSGYGYVHEGHFVPDNLAPFAAQIYLHPEYTTEEYLLENKVRERPMWALRHVCGATLIAPNWAVTAAHCFPNPNVDTSYGIRLGLNNIANEFGHLYRVQEVVRRGPTGAETRENDIALVRFDPAEASASVMSQNSLFEMAPDVPPVVTAMFDDNETLLSVINGYGTYHAVDTSTWTVVAETQFTSALTRLGDSNRLVSTAEKRGVKITPLDGGEATFLDHADVTDSFLIDQDRLIVSWSKDSGSLKVWNLKEEALIGEATVPAGFVDVRPIEGSTLLFSRDITGHIRILDVSKINERSVILHERPAPEGMEFRFLTSDGRTLLMDNETTNSVELIDTVSNQVIRYIDLFGYRLDISEDGTKALLKFPGEIYVIDLHTGVTLARVPTLQNPPGLYAQLFNDNRSVLIQDRNRRFLDVWDIVSMSRIGRVTMPDSLEQIHALKLFGDQRLAYVKTSMQDFEAERSGVAPDLDPMIYRTYAINLDTAEISAVLRQARVSAAKPTIADEERMIADVMIFGDAPKLLVTSPLGRSRIWDLDMCNKTDAVCSPMVEIGHAMSVREVSVTQKGRHLLAFTDTGTVQVWDAETGAEIQTIFHGGTIEGAKVWGDGQNLITYGTNGFVRFWDLQTGTEFRRLTFRTNLSEDGRMPLAPDPVEEPGPMLIDAAPEAGDDVQNSENIVTYIGLDETSEGPLGGNQVRVFGWGAHSRYRDGVRSQALREAGLTVLALETCRSEDYYGPRDDLHERVFCASDSVRKTCVGDSGGPVIQGNTLEDATLVGIVSWGGAECTEDGKPGVYTRIASHSDWIKSVLGDDLPQ